MANIIKGTPIQVINFWGDKIIPAIYIGRASIPIGWTEIWIPEGYGDSSGYSIRNVVNPFADHCVITDDVKKDVISKWNAELQRLET